MWNVTEKSIFRVIFGIDFDIMTTMILKNTISRFNFFRIESFDSVVCYFGQLWKKICWMSQQRTEKSIFRVIFRIDFDITAIPARSANSGPPTPADTLHSIFIV
jgi:hypothetical protein